jgi:hypothetical protein
MIEMAASIDPAEWQRGHLDRGLARRLGEGRVPDRIRLRRQRGGQGWDTSFVVRGNPDRLRDSVASTPEDVWHEIGVDPAILARAVETVLDPRTDPSHVQVVDVLRLAGLGEFVMAGRSTFSVTKS